MWVDRAFSVKGVPMPDLRLVIASDPLAVRQALTRILADPALCNRTADLRSRAEIVLAEVLNNIVEHAYAEAPGQITLEMSLRPDKVECSICDTGAQMPGLALPEGKLASRDPDNLPEGGFGWFLIRSLTEDLRYARQNDANHLYFCLPETT